ncbi:MAG: 50S ribosomal protein L11 methyltransferase [Bacteriovoracaceae bacterium]|nr:50S ribosomal protein L11 methyltransferase [Bacteriovoracaceae bacterium]
MNKYYRIVVTGKTQELTPLMTEAITNFGCQGVEEFAFEEERVDEILGERAYSGGDIPLSVINEVEDAASAEAEVSFNFFFYDDGCEERATLFYGHLESLPNVCGKLLEESWKDWNSEWRKHFTPLQISEKLHIIPEWMKGEADEDCSLYIYPGMGFGTGSHETTFICLSILEKLIQLDCKVDRVLDFGCGSGILGAASIMRKDSIVDFCDVDRDALDNTLQNLQLNFEESKLNGHRLVLRERFTIEDEYDLVFANILEHVLIQEKQIIIGGLKVGGHLVLSGILNEQVNDVIRCYTAAGLSVEEILSKGDWSGILLRRTK